jgi:hypothetical protein
MTPRIIPNTANIWIRNAKLPVTLRYTIIVINKVIPPATVKPRPVNEIVTWGRICGSSSVNPELKFPTSETVEADFAIFVRSIIN